MFWTKIMSHYNQQNIYRVKPKIVIDQIDPFVVLSKNHIE